MAAENQVVMTLELDEEDVCGPGGAVTLVEGWLSSDEDAHYLGDSDTAGNTVIQGIQGELSG